MSEIVFPLPLTLTPEMAAAIEAEFKAKDEKVVELELELEDKDEQLKKLNTIISTAKTAGSTKLETSAKPAGAKVPTSLVEVDGVEYKWNVAAFRLAGDPERHTAEEAAADKDQVIIKKILAIKGQQILIEQA